MSLAAGYAPSAAFLFSHQLPIEGIGVFASGRLRQKAILPLGS
jgi:hypothetical protein